MGATEHWIPVQFRDEEVLARCKSDGSLELGPGGLVEFAYRAGGKRYRTHADKLAAKDGAVVRAGTAADAEGAGSAESAKNGNLLGTLAGAGGVSPARKAAAPAKSAPAKSAPAQSAAAKAAPAKSAIGASGSGPIRVGAMGDLRGPDRAVQLWTDGACSGNPGPAGLGVSHEFKGERVELSEYLGEGTNNIAELMAILRGLQMVADPSVPVDVMTDSEYCIGLLGKGWKAKKNQDLVAELRACLARFGDVRLIKVPGHAGVEGNERADELARAAITNRRTTRS